MRELANSKKTTKLLILLATTATVVSLIVAASGAGLAAKANQETIKTISTAEPVTLSVCTPCHSNIDDFANPTLNFKHQGHLEKGIKCSVCHSQFPHQNDKTIKPSMERCFACHGTNHGKQGVISKDCGLCHPQGRRRPQSHTGNWATSGHKEAGRSQLFSCMMCHTQKDCIDCHNSQGLRHITLEIPPGPPPAPKLDAEEILLAAPITPAGCSPCHNNIDTFSTPGIFFSYIPARGKTGHQLHLEKGLVCQACHREFPHSPAGIKKPPMDVCADCHKVAHGEFKQIATGDCSRCHTASFDLSSKPSNHLEVGWSAVHGKQPPDILQKCYSCHELDFCTQCHKTAMPHSTFWLKDHKEPAKTDPRDCRICHQEKGYCNNCHHADKKAVMTKICKECHSNFTKSWKQLSRDRERKLALHKAHTAKKWTCNKCHVVGETGLPELGLFVKDGTAISTKEAEKEHLTKEKAESASSLTICDNKDCHHPDYPGKEGLIIGNELCRLCHPEK